MGLFDNPMGSIFGDSNDSGLLGLGQFHGENYQIDKNAFNPNQQETDFTSALQARMNGQGPSVAEQQMQAGLGQAQANAMGTAAATHGIGAGLAARMAMQNQASMAQNANQQAGQLRAQEQLNASSQLGQELQSQRQGRMGAEQLGVEQQTGINAVNAAAYGDAAARRANFSNNLGMGGMSSLGLADGGIVPQAAGGITPAYQNPEMQSFQSGLAHLQQQVATPALPIQQTQLKKSDGGGGGGGMMKGLMGMVGGGSGGGEAASTGLMAGGAADAAGAAAGGSSLSSLLPLLLLASKGAVVPGKAQVPGDHKVNDTVPAMLSPGEIVIPRTVVAKGPEAVASFAAALMKKGA